MASAVDTYTPNCARSLNETPARGRRRTGSRTGGGRGCVGRTRNASGVGEARRVSGRRAEGRGGSKVSFYATWREGARPRHSKAGAARSAHGACGGAVTRARPTRRRTSPARAAAVAGPAAAGARGVRSSARTQRVACAPMPTPSAKECAVMTTMRSSVFCAFAPCRLENLMSSCLVAARRAARGVA